jgi:hypothetical protein
MRAEPRTVHESVTSIQTLGKGYIKFLFGNNSTLFDNIAEVFLQTSSGTLSPTLLPRALGINEMVQTSLFTEIRREFMSNKLRSLIGD